MLSLKKEFNLTNKDNIQSIYFVGDIHGEFNQFKYELTPIENAIVVLCGDIGIGFHKPKHYENIFLELQQICEKRNIYICLVRGNHDDPHYFQADSLYHLSENLCRDYPNVIFIKDYDIILTKFGNILAIGGAVSIDRTSRSLNKDFWSNEFVKPLTIDDYNRLNEYAIDIVVTHTAPSTFLPYGVNSSIVDFYTQYDRLLQYDLLEEREMLDKIFLHLMMKWRPKDWYYGHYHMSNYELKDYLGNEIKCHGLDCHEFKLYNVGFE